MKIYYEKYKAAIQKTLFAAGFIIFTYIFMNYLFSYVAPFVFALLLALALTPVSRFLEKKLKIWRSVSAMLTLIFFLAIIGSVGTGVATRIFNEARSLFSVLSVYFQNLNNNYDTLKSKYLDLISFVPPEFQNTVDNTVSSLITSLAQSAGYGVSSTTGSLITVIPNFVISLCFTFISAFFIIKDRESITASIIKHSPKWLNEKYSLIKQGVLTDFTGYLKAQFILTLFSSIICTAGLHMLRNPYALFLGLSIAITDMLPFIGAGLILWPWALVSLISGDYALSASLAAIYLAVLISRQIVEPRVRRIGVHPVVNLISIYLGIKLFGLIGLYLGPACAVVVKVFVTISPNYKSV